MITLSAWEWAENPPVGVPLAAIDAAVAAMERAGVRLDTDFLRAGELSARHDQQTERLALRHWVKDVGWMEPTSTSREWADSLWTSPQKLQVFLHSKLGINIPKSPFWKFGKVKEGEVKLDGVALDYLAGRHKEHRANLKRLIQLRRTTGALKYLAKLPGFIGPDGLVHPTFGAAGDADDRSGAITGRQACKNPELQQIPRDKKKDRYRIRTGFIAGPGEALVVLDYSALEVVILAHILIALFGDYQLAEMIAPGAPDIHSVNAVRVFRDVLGYPGFENADAWIAAHPKDGIKNHPDKMVREARDLIKAIWYGLQYGKERYGFGNTLFDAHGDPIGEDAAGRMVDGIKDVLPGLRRYQEWVQDYIDTHGGICDLGGRWCDLRELLAGDKWSRARAYRRALNFPMQGGGATIVGAAMAKTAFDPVLQALGYQLVLSVHDELHFRGPARHAEEALERAKFLMTDFPLYVPLQVAGSTADNWEEAK